MKTQMVKAVFLYSNNHQEQLVYEWNAAVNAWFVYENQKDCAPSTATKPPVYCTLSFSQHWHTFITKAEVFWEGQFCILI